MDTCEVTAGISLEVEIALYQLNRPEITSKTRDKRHLMLSKEVIMKIVYFNSS